MIRQNWKVTGGSNLTLMAFVVFSLAACYGLSDSATQRIAKDQMATEVCFAGHARYHRMNRTPAYRGYGFQGMGTLPTGRRTWQGRYFGNINNRYYGPQYGYF
jgi:hypothetical protein